MSLKFRYQLIPTKKAIVSLAGRLVRPRPMILVTVIGPTGTSVERAYLDPMKDDCVFPEDVADKIGIDLTNAPQGEAEGVGKVPVPLRYAQGFLRLANGGERHEWRAWVAFTPAQLHRPLLGFAGFLQFFTATFHGDKEEVELAVNSQYQGA
jgi:hypothetical protein